MDRSEVPKAADIMRRKLLTLRADTPVVDAAKLLIKNRVSGAPVTDDDGRLLGLFSEFDCLRAVASADYESDGYDAIERVGDIMSREPYTIPPTMDLFAIAHEFVSLRVRRFPVVDDGRLVGQVSRRDALAAAVKLRQAMARARHQYPDYPAGRNPIRDYPRH